ncbi:MAG: histidine phosphatase family protein [Pseudomonadota bacterium]
MTRRLILVRHAKSDWGTAGLSDHDRPLNARGRRSAPRIGAWLAGGGFVPDQVLCSTARRTQETWAGIAAHLPKSPAPHLEPRLYHATPEVLRAVIDAAEGRTIAVIGHNPGIGALAHLIADVAPQHAAFDLYPTGATTVFEMPGGTWPEIALGAGRVLAFGVPRDLPDPA